MRMKYGLCALALLACVSLAPLAAKADLTADQTAAIQSAVDTAMKSGDASALKTVLTQLVTANQNDAGAAATVAMQQIANDVAANPSLATTAGAAAVTSIADSVTSSVVTAIVTAAPSQAGNVLAAAQSALPASQTQTAVTATQQALAPAAGGPGQQQQIAQDIRNITQSLQNLVNSLIQTAEQARRSTASPHS